MTQPPTLHISDPDHKIDVHSMFQTRGLDPIVIHFSRGAGVGVDVARVGRDGVEEQYATGGDCGCP